MARTSPLCFGHNVFSNAKLNLNALAGCRPLVPLLRLASRGNFPQDTDHTTSLCAVAPATGTTYRFE